MLLLADALDNEHFVTVYMAEMTENLSYLSFYLSKTSYNFSKIGKELGKKESIYLLKEASNAVQICSYGILGIDGFISLLKYRELAQRNDLKGYEKTIKRTLLADIGTKLSTASAGLSYMIDDKNTQEVLKSTQSLAGFSTSLISSLFLASYAVLIGANLTRAYAVNKALTKENKGLDLFISKHIDNHMIENIYNKLDDNEKASVINALLNIPPTKLNSKTANSVYNHLSSKNIDKNQLLDKYQVTRKLRFKRNGYMQTSLAYGLCLGVGLTLLAFPPSSIAIAATAIAGVSFKIGWDYYRQHAKNMQDNMINKLKENSSETILPIEVNVTPNEESIKPYSAKFCAWTQLDNLFKAKKKEQRVNGLLQNNQQEIRPGQPLPIDNESLFNTTSRIEVQSLEVQEERNTESKRVGFF